MRDGHSRHRSLWHWINWDGSGVGLDERRLLLNNHSSKSVNHNDSETFRGALFYTSPRVSVAGTHLVPSRVGNDCQGASAAGLI